MNFEKLIQDLIEKNWALNYHFLSAEDCKNLINEFNPEVFSKAKEENPARNESSNYRTL